MARTATPITDDDIIRAAASDWLTRSGIARKVNRTLHPMLIDRINRLASGDGAKLFCDPGVMPNGVVVYYYKSTPEALQALADAHDGEKVTQHAFA